MTKVPLSAYSRRLLNKLGTHIYRIERPCKAHVSDGSHYGQGHTWGSKIHSGERLLLGIAMLLLYMELKLSVLGQVEVI